jgi:hypothetical protein
MKKFMVAAVLVAFAACFAVAAFADDEGMKCPMMKCAEGDMKPCPMCMIKVKCMTGKGMVATEDGSVVVLVGNKLFKYDKNLQLKKEAEIKCDVKEACEKMCKECPRCQAAQKTEVKAAAAPVKAEPVAKKDKR